MPIAVGSKLKQVSTKVAAAWAAIQVDRYGKYSVDRLHQLNEYQRTNSRLRSWVVVALTPLPCLAVVTLLDTIPINPPSLGLSHSHSFWLRAFLMANAIYLGIMVQLGYLVPRLSVSRSQIVWIPIAVSVSTLTATVVMANRFGYPLPFMIGFGSPGSCVAFAICLYVVWGKLLRENPEAREELANYFVLVMKQASLPYVYAAFSYGFSNLASSGQVALALLLPVLKIAVKNWISRSVNNFEDFKPELIIFNVEIFHALNVAFSMQNASSRSTAAVLMALDCAHACASLRGLNSLARSWRADLQLPRHSIRDSTNTGGSHRVAPLQDLERSQKPQLLRLVLLMLETDRSILQNSAIRLKSSTGSNNLSTPLGAKTLPCATQSDPAFEKRKPDTEPKSARAPRSPTAITPTAPPKPKPTLQDNSVLSEEMICIVSSLGPSERREKVENALKLLHMTEFFVLVEYTEVIIPLVYCLYLLVMSNLPNRVYYAQLKDLDDAKLQRTVVNVLMYAFLELLSFLALSWFLGKKLMVSSIYQLAFVLETQWQMVQSKLILWVVLTVQSSLEHFGADYSFQFKWLHANTSQ